MFSRALTFAVASLALCLPANAQQIESTYTDLDLDLCSIVSSDDFGTTWACPGYKGIPVMVAEGDLRFFVSYGLTSTTERAASQTLPPFNYAGPRIEWRMDNLEGRWKPFATILRFFVQAGTDEPEGQILVVTKLAPDATCHVAYVDAKANSNANELAREAADELARDFDCDAEPETRGAFRAW